MWNCLFPLALLSEMTWAYLADVQRSPVQPGPGFGLSPSGHLVRPSARRSRLYSGLTSGLIDSDMLQDKPCGISVNSYPPSWWNNLQPSDSSFLYTCKCKAYSDSFNVQQIDNSELARQDCLTDISHHYCCMRT